MIDGTYQKRIFVSDENVWDIVELLIQETKEANAKGGSFNIAESVNAQIPFFACRNVFLDKDSQKDIARFIYSKDYGISPYKGTYGEQPARWVAKSFLIKNLIERQKIKATKDGKT